MSLPRSPFLAMLVPVVLASVAHAQTPPAFPVKPVRLVVPFPAGGPTDAAARLLQPKLIESLGQPVVIDNRSGASTIIGTEAVAKSPADGHVWLMTTSSIAINPAVHTKLPYDTVRDLAPVTLVLSNPFLLVTHPALPVKSAADLIRLAKSKPGQLMYPSSGVGSSNHLAGVQFSMMAGIDTLIHYPVPPHRQQAFGEWANRSYPVTERLHAEVLSLPISPVLDRAAVSAVIDACNTWRRA